jgi:hypothetical protein
MMDCYDNGCRLGESLGYIRVHADFRRTSTEVIDLLKLAVGYSSERCEGSKKLHRVQAVR